MTTPVTVEMIRELLAKITPGEIGYDEDAMVAYTNHHTSDALPVFQTFTVTDLRFFAASPAIAHYALELSEQLADMTMRRDTQSAYANANYIEWEKADEECKSLRTALAESEARVAAFERKEYICQRCWLRHDPPNKDDVGF